MIGAFLKFVFWFLLVLYLLALAGRLLLRYFLRTKVRQFEQQMGQQQQAQGRRQKARGERPEGEVTIERIDVKEKQVNRRVGEYVDYQEVDQKEK